MNDYKTALKEYQELQCITNIQIGNIQYLIDLSNSFKNGLTSLKEYKNISLDNTSGELNFLQKNYDNFFNEMNKIFFSYNEKIVSPLKIAIDTFKTASNDNLKSFNKIKSSLIESKQKVTKTKEDYYNFIKSSSINDKIKGDESKLFKAKKDNYAQLYKYEINKMNEIITQYNKDYEKIIKTLNEVNLTTNYILKNILVRFSKHVADIGNLFIKFSEELNESINTNLKQYENSEIYIPQIDKKTNLRFNLEKFKEYDENNMENININQEQNNIYEKKEESKNKTEDNSIREMYLKRLVSLPRKGFDDFEIIDRPIVEMSQERMKENINKLKEIIKKLTSEIELTPIEVDQLINILKEEPLEHRETFSYIFLTQIKKYYKNRVINLKNRQNFIHLANIMNNLCIKENNTKTFNAIIEVSQMIKYENLFMYCMIQKKNSFFSTKTFWLRVIQENLIDNINAYCNKLLNPTTNDKNKNNKSKPLNTKKNIKYMKNLLSKTGLNKDITNYNQLYEEQKNELDQYAYENICILLSKTIPGMCSFLVPEFTSIDIIDHYSTLFGFDIETKKYFQNILEVKNIRNTLSLKKHTEKSIKKNTMFNILFIISSTLKFLPQNEFLNLLPINKFLKPYIEKKIFKFLLSKDLTIEKRIFLWEKILNVKKAIQQVNYENVKSLMKERIEKNEIDIRSQEGRNLNTIEVDLIRTPYISKHKEDKEKLEWVLKCLNYAKPDVGYCQGMNYLGSFFYQLLNKDEEKTFNFLFALETQTKYEQLFFDDLRMLKIFFIVLDKVINLYKPEIYYKFVDSNLSTNIYSTPWFVTLFSNLNCVFEPKDATKYSLMVIENFIIDGWSALFNSGYTLTRYYFDKIMKIEEENLINFMIKGICEEDIVKNENFDKIKKLYEKNSEKINELLIRKLVKITRYENVNSFLKNN